MFEGIILRDVKNKIMNGQYPTVVFCRHGHEYSYYLKKKTSWPAV